MSIINKYPKEKRVPISSFKLTKLRRLINQAEEDILVLESKKQALICAKNAYNNALEALENMLILHSKK